MANELRRDIVATGQHDHLTVALDTFLDRRNGYFFLVTANGGVFDALMTDERIINGDWNTVWNFRSGRFEGGWTVEMSIPFKSLRYKPGRDQVWGLQLRRTIRHKNEMTYLKEVPAGWGISAILRMSAQATLVGVEVPGARRPTSKSSPTRSPTCGPTGWRRHPSATTPGPTRAPT